MGARVFGAVLNRVETRAGGYFRKTYREFYEYHEEDEGGEGGVKRNRLFMAASQSLYAVYVETQGAHIC